MAPRETKKEEPVVIDNPRTFAEFYRQGWAQHAAGKQEAAEASLRKAIELEPNSVDAFYTLGLTLKKADRRREAVEAFRQALDLIAAGALEHGSRSEMVRRLSLGHINQIEKGNWNLEKEIWQREDQTPTENV